MAGRPPTPPQLSILKGTFRKDRHGDKDAVISEEVVKEVPNPPENKGDEFVRRWNVYCGLLINCGVLTHRDLAAVEQVCELHQMVVNAQEAIDKDGEYGTDEKGKIVAHPALIRKESAMKMVSGYHSALGLNPAARAKVAFANKSNSPQTVPSLQTKKRLT